MTPKEKLLKDIENLDCIGLDCDDCPMFNIDDNFCERIKFKELCRERLKPKICSKCGQEFKG